MFQIIPFESSYRDDMIFCLLSAKDALGRIPRINEDLLDISKNYFDKGNMFWLAIDDNNRVVGMLGVNIISSNEAWLRRLYVKPTLKRNGLGRALLTTAENYVRQNGVATLHTRTAADYHEASKFYPAQGFVEIGNQNGISHRVKYLT